MKFCPKCNSEYDDAVVFCTRDGSPLKANPGMSTLRSPGMTLSSGGGSALGMSALRTSTPNPVVARALGGNGAALALAREPIHQPTPVDGLTREVEITPHQPTPLDDDVVPGSELDPYADSPTLAIAAPVIHVANPPDGPARPLPPKATPVRGVVVQPPAVEPVSGPDTTPPPAGVMADAFDEEPEEPDLSGQTIAGRYRVVRRLGEGGMGVVYQAIDERLEKAVALKVLKEDFSKRQDVVARFTQEAKSAARIKHENVLDVTDYGKTESGSYYIAMELLVGTDLADVLHRGEAITVERATDIAVQICRALSAAHSLGVVHRDMKPENVFLLKSNEGREVVKIVDFGIAQMKDSAGGENTRKLTRTGMIFGTPEYMSPEQASGKAIDHRVDVYATGVILYEMFAGRVPFVGDTFMGVLTQHMFDAPPTIAELNPNSAVTPEFTAVIYKALAKDPNQRYGSMAEFAEDLQRVRLGVRPTAPGGDFVVGNPLRGPTPAPLINSPAPQPGPAPSPPASVGALGSAEGELPKRRSPVPFVALGVVVLLAVVGIAFALGSNSRPPEVVAPTPVPPAANHPTAVHPTTPPPVVAPPVVAPPVVAPPVVAPPVVAPPAPVLVAMQVVTEPPGLRVEGQPTDGNGVAFTCTAPCTQNVPAHVAMRLSVTRGARHGSVMVDPAEGMAPVHVAFDPVSAHRPTTAPSANAHPPATAPCVPRVDHATGLLIPCFQGNHR